MFLGGAPQPSDFWSLDCPERGPSLSHAHWRSCDPNLGHPGGGPKHEWTQCCHCEHTADSWQKEMGLQAAEEAGGVSLDNLPLALEQPDGCVLAKHRSLATTPLIGANGLEWPTCTACGQQQEPSLAKGKLTGPVYGPGRGWITPRMEKRWAAIAHRLRGQFG